MVTTLTVVQRVSLVVAILVALFLAPALVYAYTWLQMLRRNRAQQARGPCPDSPAEELLSG